MAKEIKTGEIVALKKIRMDNEREGVCMYVHFFLFISSTISFYDAHYV